MRFLSKGIKRLNESLFSIKIWDELVLARSWPNVLTCGRAVRASDSQSGPGFESRSSQLLDLFSVVQFKSSAMLLIANWLPPASWVLNPVMLCLKYLSLSI